MASTNTNTVNINDIDTKINVRESKMAGWRAGRGKGKWALTIVLLVYCILSRIPIVQSMSGITFEQLQSALKDNIRPVVSEIRK